MEELGHSKTKVRVSVVDYREVTRDSEEFYDRFRDEPSPFWV